MGVDYFVLCYPCCCLPTTLTFASVGSLSSNLWSTSSFSDHLASSVVTQTGSVHKSRGDNLVRMWVQLKRWCVLCVWVLQRRNSGDGCDLALTLCKYDLGKGDLFVLSWAMVRRVRRESISSELLMCGGDVHSILSMHRVAICPETIGVCIWRNFVFYVCCSDRMGICWNVCCVAAVVEDSGVLTLKCKSMVYVCIGDVMDVVVSLCIVRRGAVSDRLWEVCVCVSSCICYMFVSCVHLVAFLNAMYWMACSSLILVKDTRGNHTEEAYSRASLITALYR